MLECCDCLAHRHPGARDCYNMQRSNGRYRGLRQFVLLLCAFAVLGGRSLPAAEGKIGPPVRDPTKIVGADQCAKCHEKEVQQWMRTPHFATFDTLHRLPQAKEI